MKPTGNPGLANAFCIQRSGDFFHQGVGVEWLCKRFGAAGGADVGFDGFSQVSATSTPSISGNDKSIRMRSG